MGHGSATGVALQSYFNQAITRISIEKQNYSTSCESCINIEQLDFRGTVYVPMLEMVYTTSK